MYPCWLGKGIRFREIRYKNLAFGGDGHASVIVAIWPPSDNKKQ